MVELNSDDLEIEKKFRVKSVCKVAKYLGNVSKPILENVKFPYELQPFAFLVVAFFF